MAKGAWVAVAQTALTAVMWGTSFPAVAVGLAGGLTPSTFLLLRFFMALPIMALAGRALGKGFVPFLRMKEVWALALLNAFGFYCQFYGQQYTSASVAALLVNLSLVMAAAGGALFLGESLGGLKLAGVAAAAVGAALVTTNGDLASVTRGEALGDALYLAAAVSWAGYIVYSKKKTDQKGWEPFGVATAIVAATALLVVPPALAVGVPAALSSGSWAAVGYTAVFNTAIPYVLYQRGLGGLSAGSFSVILMLEIVTGVLVSVLLLGESLTPVAWAGAGMLVASILLVSGLEVKGVAQDAGPGAQGAGPERVRVSSS